MAMEKLGQIHRDAQKTGDYDLIVVDTPPSRSALDFLDAPERLSSFLDGQFILLLLTPALRPVKLMTAGFYMMTKELPKSVGPSVLQHLLTFLTALNTHYRGLVAR